MNSTLIMMVKVLTIISSLVSTIMAQSTLISVVQVFRHGQRTPYYHYPNDPYSDAAYWPVSSGQLTNVGKTQCYLLGQYTRGRYNSSLPTAYNSDFIYAQTTDIDRAHMSAQCNLLGLFPPTTSELWNTDIAWSPIPVHPTDKKVLNGPCAAYATERKRVMENELYYQNIDKTYAETFAYLTEHSGLNVTTLSDIGSTYDCLLIENEFGFILPSWSESVFPEPLRTLVGYAIQSFGYNTKLVRLGAGVILNEIMEHFEKMKDDPSSAQFFRLYSAHDLNIVTILSGLGAFEPHPPHFASTIYFELWKSVLGTYYVNIYYRNEGVVKEITPTGCLKFDCEIGDLKEHLSSVLIDADTWTKECAA